MDSIDNVPTQDLLKARIEGASPDDPRLTKPMKLEVTRENGKLKRSSFACVGCHSLKQKCWPSDLDDIYRKPCQRCLRQQKVCTFDLSKRTRKRQPRKNSNAKNTSKDISSPLSSSSKSSKISSPNESQPKRSIAEVYFADNNDTQSANRTPPGGGYDVDGNLNAGKIGLNNFTPAPSNDLPSGNTPTLPGIHIFSGILGDSVPANPQPTSSSIGEVISSPYTNPLTKNLQTERNVGISRGNKKLTNHGNIHLNHSFKKQLQSLLMHQREENLDLTTKFNSWSDQWNSVVQTTMFLPSIKDPIAVGIISTNEADVRLKLYKEEISTLGKLSFIKIPADITVDQLRSEKPILFSVIMSVVSVIMEENETTRETIMKLDSFVINLLTNQIFKVNNKSIEIIEAHIVLCTWYNFLEWSNKTRYHLFNYIGCCLTKDLGPMFVNRAFAMFSDDAPAGERTATKSPLELYTNGPRIILLVYITSLNISIFLKQTIQFKWNDLMVLATNRLQQQIKEHMANQDSPSPNNSYDIEDDIVLVCFAELNHVLEKIHVYLHEMTDLFDLDDITIKERYIQKLLVRYRADLQDLYDRMPKHRKRLLTFYYSVEAYFHQFEIQYYLKKLYELRQSGVTSGQQYESIKANAVRSFIECYNCCISALQEFSQLTPTLIASIPLFLMSRIIYTVGVLLLRLRYSVVAFPIFHHLLELTDNCVLMVNDVRELLRKSSKQYPYNYFLYKFQYVVGLFVQTYAKKVIDLFEATAGTSTKALTGIGSGILDESIQLNPQVLYDRSQDNTWIRSKMKDIRNKRHTTFDLFPTADQNILTNQTNAMVNTDRTSDVRRSISNNDSDIRSFSTAQRFPNGDLNNGIEPVNINEANSLLNLNRLPGDSNMASTNIPDADNIKRSASALSFTRVSKPATGEAKTTSPSVSITSDNLNDYLTDANSLSWGFNALNDEFWTDLILDDI